MKNYLDILSEVKEDGVLRGNRTGTGTKYLFSRKFRHRMSDGFPLLTTKKVNAQAVFGEMFAFLTGATTTVEFEKYGCKIWNPWGLDFDIFDLIKTTDAEQVKALSEKLSITEPEAMAKLDAVQHTAVDWNLKLVDWSLKIASGEIDITNPDKTPPEYTEHIANQPQSKEAFLREHDVNVYRKEMRYMKGDLGPIYGAQWINWKTSTGELINQIKRIAEQLEHTPESRRIILTGWNPEVIPEDKYTSYPNGKPCVTSKDQINCAVVSDKQALPPCHLLTILDVHFDHENKTKTLNLELIMRSTDVPIGLPYNIASYALLLCMMADQFGYERGELVIEMVNCHIYENQLEFVDQQLARTPTKLPTLDLVPPDIAFDRSETLTPENLSRVLALIKDYEPQAHIPYPVTV